ncbi:hypothetical protein AB0F72_08355 [Actinoplanes sp. NPDC023936]|uniref:hypothetical protein n=1 Tax=Actinoplanes sp. NPDC023936 TaxID=3154910 RepID=UPI0033C94F79
MAKFEIGDQVRMTDVHLVVEVLENGTCEDYRRFKCWPETFRFKDPESGEDDWAHTDEFEKVPA